MEIKGPGLRRSEMIALSSGLAALVVLMLVYDKPAFYDEDDYLRNVVLLQQHGFSKAYLLKHIGSAGPLYAALHYILEPVTKLQTPYIRLVNILLLIGSMWFTGQTLKKLLFPQSFALLALAVPMTYVISGLALTEMPAVFFFCAAVYLIVKAFSVESSFMDAALRVAAAGLFLSFAILGRQPFLLALGVLPILFFRKGDYLKRGGLLAITIAFSLAIPGYVFYVWQGLVAPDDAALYTRIAEEGASLKPVFFFYCTAYYAVIFFIVTPSFYLLPALKERLVLMVLASAFVLINFQYRLILYLPMKIFAELILSPSVLVWAEVVFGAAILIGSLYFIGTLILQLRRHNYQRELVFFAAALILVAIACVKITWGFSSRYPAQALPFFVPMFAYFYTQKKLAVYRLAAGVILGLISFASYIATTP